jgi:hypothetical protein
LSKEQHTALFPLPIRHHGSARPGEGRHQLARAIFQGRRGKLRLRYCECQEDQLGALGIVVHMDAALNQLSVQGMKSSPNVVNYRTSASNTSTGWAGSSTLLPEANSGPYVTQQRPPLTKHDITQPNLLCRFSFRCCSDPSYGNGSKPVVCLTAAHPDADLLQPTP